MVRPGGGLELRAARLRVPAPGLCDGVMQGAPAAGAGRRGPAGLSGGGPSDGPLLLPEAAVPGVHKEGGGVAGGADGAAAAQQSAQRGECLLINQSINPSVSQCTSFSIWTQLEGSCHS